MSKISMENNHQIHFGGPLVTVLMPCKDAKASFFSGALNSVFSQSTSLWNLIVIDNHSNDMETIKVLRELSYSRDKRVSVLKYKSNLITGALNTGMRQAKTPYVCSLHCKEI